MERGAALVGLLLGWGAVAGALLSLNHAQAAPKELVWTKTVLDTEFRSEGVSVGDVNRDGLPDVMAGQVWYEAPHWERHDIRPPKKYDAANGYSDCFLSFAADVDRDRWIDQIVIGFPGAPAVWYRNPGSNGENWTEHPVTASACNESPIFVDLDRDKQPELVSPFQEKRMALYRPGAQPLVGMEQQLVGETDKPGCKRFSHGLGHGDVDGDGRTDILCNEGYYQQPKQPSDPWPFVPAALGPNCAQMYVHDFDGDGDGDVISSSAHHIGVWWYEQQPGKDGRPTFVQHTIDNTFSQSHSLMMADLNRDGRPDFVTGKRWWAHGPKGDVQPMEPAVLVWYEYSREKGQVTWTKHLIDTNSGVGTQFTVADLNRDGRLDIITSNKKGVHVLVQRKG